MILGRLWMKKHGVLLDIINNSITFFPRYCKHFEALLSLIPLKSINKAFKKFYLIVQASNNLNKNIIFI